MEWMNAGCVTESRHHPHTEVNRKTPPVALDKAGGQCLGSTVPGTQEGPGGLGRPGIVPT